jgi:hypothetical protein
VTGNKIWKRINQSARHIEHEVIREVLVVDNTDLRVRYLLNEIDERTFKQQIQQRDRRHQRLTEIHAILQLYVVTTLEVFIEIDRNKSKYESCSEETALFERHCAFIENMINAPLRAIGDKYRNAVPQILYNNFPAYDPRGYKPVRETKPRTKSSSSNVVDSNSVSSAD